MNTKSEDLFEELLNANGVRFARVGEVKEKAAKRPDYLVEIAGLKIMFEVKQLGNEEGPEHGQHIRGRQSPGAQLRRLISRSKKQIQFGADQSIASVLLVYNNNDPLQLNGTEAVDFSTAMYGELTVLVDRHTREKSELFHGRKNEMQESKNTSFSAVGH